MSIQKGEMLSQSEMAQPTPTKKTSEVLLSAHKYDAARSKSQNVVSSQLAATIQSAGIREGFIELQNHLREIEAAKSEIEAYGSGKMFNDIYKEFYGGGSSYRVTGTVENEHGQGVIRDTRKRLRYVSAVLVKIEEALLMVTQLYRRVETIITNQGADAPPRSARYENLLAWAKRKGVQLNPRAYGNANITMRTHAYTHTADLYELLDLFDGLRFELESYRILPAYYRTGTDGGDGKLQTPVQEVYLMRGETLQSFSNRVLGDPDKAPLILEFNDLVYADLLADGWDQRMLKIPMRAAPDGERLANNFVLDAQSGVKILGKDLPNELDVEDGDLKVLDYTDTFNQSIENLLVTPEGSYIDENDYGSMIKNFAANSPGKLGPGMVSAEAIRAVMKNPRVSAVGKSKATISGDRVTLQMEVTAINNISVAELTKHMETEE